MSTILQSMNIGLLTVLNIVGSPPDDIHLTDSQLMTVTYEDPEDKLQQEKFLAQIRKYGLFLLLRYFK